MDRLILTLGGQFAAIQAAAVLAHFLGPSPFGGPLVDEPMRLLPEGLLINLAIVLGLAVAFACASGLVWLRLASSGLCLALRRTYLALAVAYTAFNQFDLEVVRWLGQHVNASYLQNYFGLGDLHLLLRILRSDAAMTVLALGFVFAASVLAALAFRRGAEPPSLTSRRAVALWVGSVCLAGGLAHSMRPSEKRWRRVQPGLLVLAEDFVREIQQVNRPNDRERALRDLVDFVRNGQLSRSDATSTSRADETYPLVTASEGYTPDEFLKRPRSDRPNIVFIVFETLRGWKTGLASSVELGLTPELDQLVRTEAAYFPWVHSNGFPSVEGCMSLHLGIWPDTRRIVFSEFLHIKTRSWTEILRDYGYYTYAIQGADPSFDNFTPWIRRWYDQTEYRAENRHDAPLVDRFIEKHRELTTDQRDPFVLMLWTATTHPSYDVPPDAGVAVAADSEARYDQAVFYSQAQIVRLIRHLQAQPQWENTIVFIVGDHSQPNPYQRANPQEVGLLSPGHTWTNFAILGGWKGLPPAGARAQLISHVDIPPTLLSLLRIGTTHHFMGRDVSGLPALPFDQASKTEGEFARPAFSFGYGEAVWQTKHARVSFSPTHQDVLSQRLDPSTREGFGLLDESARQALTSNVPPEVDLERYRDLVRAYATLLDEDRIYPK